MANFRNHIYHTDLDVDSLLFNACKVDIGSESISFLPDNYNT